MPTAFDYNALDAALRSAGLLPDAAQYHGALCGALCTRKAGDIDLLALLETPAEGAADATALETLGALRDATQEALSGDGSDFAPLLPDDARTLVERTRALASWCDGFLFGLASSGKLDLERASDEVREAVSDITQFTNAALEAGDDVEGEESAFAELVEYLRVVVQLIHLEFHGAPAPPAAKRPMH